MTSKPGAAGPRRNRIRAGPGPLRQTRATRSVRYELTC